MSIADDVKNLEASLAVAREQREEARTIAAKVVKERDDALSLVHMRTANLDRMRSGRDNALAALAAMTKERDDARKHASFLNLKLDATHTNRCFKCGETVAPGIDPSKWRGPHGDPRDDDTHRWREVTVDGVTVLLRCVRHQTDEYWWNALGRSNIAPTIDAACAAADEYVAGLVKPKERTFTVLPWEGARGTPHNEADAILDAVDIKAGASAWQFLLDHAALFRDGGSIVESEVQAWLDARGGK